MPEYDGSIIIDSHIDTTNFDNDANKIFNKLRLMSDHINDSFRNINIQNIGTQIKNTFVSLNISQITSQIEAINQSITKIGNNRAPGKLKDNFASAGSSIKSIFSGLGDSINKRLKNAFSGVSDIFSNITRRFNWIVLGQAIRAVINDAKESIKDLRTYSSDFDNTMQSLRDSAKRVGNSIATAFAPALQALAPIIANVSMWLTDLFNKIAMFNAALFTGSKTAVIADTSFSGYSKSADKAAASSKKGAKAAQEEMKALAKFDKLDVFKKDKKKGADSGAGDVIPQAMKMFKTVEVPQSISDFANKIKETFRPLGEEFKIVGDSFQQNFVAPVAQHVKENILPRFAESTKKAIAGMDFSKLNASLDGFFKVLSKITKSLFDGLEWAWENLLLPIIDKTITDYLPKYLDALTSALESLNTLWQTAKPYLQTLVSWLKELGDPLIKGALDGLKSTLDSIRWAVEVICPPIKRLGEALRNIHIPQGVKDLFYMLGRFWGGNFFNPSNLGSSAFFAGITTGAFHLRKHIPGLASGTVVSPNKKFLAMLGDNDSEQEVVSPVSTMKQAFMEAMSETGMSGRSGDVVLQLDGTTFARLINPYTKAEQSRIGVSMIEGVAY